MSKSVQESFPWLTVRRYEGVTRYERGGPGGKGRIGAPSDQQTPGFISYNWVDAGNGVMISVSVFTNREAEEDSNRIAADFVKKQMAPLLPNPPGSRPVTSLRWPQRNK